MQMNEAAQEILADIFKNSERPDKMKIVVDEQTHKITLTYEDLDEEWFKDLVSALSPAL